MEHDSPHPRGPRAAWLLPLLIATGAALAEPQDIVLSPCNNVATTFSLKTGQAVPVNSDIEVAGASGNVFWAVSPAAGCSGGPTVFTCAGMTVTAPNPDVAVPSTTKVVVTGAASSTLSQGQFTLTVADEAGAKTCNGTYTLRATAEGGGWGDPHLTTVDGIHYDFQSAGEFVALRENGFEVQTRQTAVPSAAVPIADSYAELNSCVSVYTAVAARIGSNRVTLQPGTGIGLERTTKQLQLRVNGKPVTLTANGINLIARLGGRRARVEGRIVRTAADKIEITDARGTQLVVTHAFWEAQQTPYLNVNVYQTTANQGTMAPLAAGSWLPALPDGSSLGPKPASAQERYDALYEKFADAWRVTAATSLFDYAPGTDTGTFTLDEWPRFEPRSCDIQGRNAARPATEDVAQLACRAIENKTLRADCVFDVMVTGHTGFARSYRSLQAIKPHGSGWHHSPTSRKVIKDRPTPTTPTITITPGLPVTPGTTVQPR